MSSKKARNQINQKVEHAELKQENERLLKEIERLSTANILLKAQAETGERYRQDAIRREVDNEYLEARNRWLRQDADTFRAERDMAEAQLDIARRGHEHAKEGMRNKLRDLLAIRKQLENAAKNLTVLPDHYDTHTECYSDSDLISALVKEITQQRGLVEHWKTKWHSLWAAFERSCKRKSILMSAASDVYEMCFDDDDQKQVRHLRRVLRVLGAIFTPRTKETVDAKKLA